MLAILESVIPYSVGQTVTIREAATRATRIYALVYQDQFQKFVSEFVNTGIPVTVDGEARRTDRYLDDFVATFFSQEIDMSVTKLKSQVPTQHHKELDDALALCPADKRDVVADRVSAAIATSPAPAGALPWALIIQIIMQILSGLFPKPTP